VEQAVYCYCIVDGLWWTDPGWMPGAQQAALSLPPPQQDRGENITKDLWTEIRARTDCRLDSRKFI